MTMRKVLPRSCANPPGEDIGVSFECTQTADLVVAYLEQLEIDYVFGVPGGAIEPLYNALARSSRRGGPRPVVARHESGAAYMADGYFRETGKLGVCCATSGPGATNLITGVACAFDNNIPMLVITGQPSLPSFGKRALQESACTGINTLGMFRHCTRYDTLVSHPDQVESKLMTGLQRAMSVPRGPVHLSFPLDILKSPSAVRTPSYQLAEIIRPASVYDPDAVDQLFHLLERAENPRLLIGGGCGEAISRILQFALLRSIPFVTTPDGKGLVSPCHPLYEGVFGFAGHRGANNALNDDSVDLLVAIGSSMNEWTSSGWSDSLLNERLVHIDDSSDNLARTPMARLHVHGRIVTIFDHLLDCHHARHSGELRCLHFPSNPLTLLDSPAAFTADATPIKPQRLMSELGLLFPPGTRFHADAGNSIAWATHYLQPRDRRQGERRESGHRRFDRGRRNNDGSWLRVTMDFAPMGWAIGAAIGTALADRDIPVVCITGDGSLLMNGQELTVAVAEELTVIFVVLNDGALGMVKHGQRLAGAERIAFELPPIDFAAVARAMGAEAQTIVSPQDLARLDIESICNRRGPTLLDIHVDGEEVPPMNLRMRVLGTKL